MLLLFQQLGKQASSSNRQATREHDGVAVKLQRRDELPPETVWKFCRHLARISSVLPPFHHLHPMPRDRDFGDPGPSLALFLYGLMTMMLGAVAYNEDVMSDAALAAIFVGNGSAVLMFGCAAALRDHGRLAAGDAGWREYVLGLHVGIVLPVLYTALCAWRIREAWGVEGKALVVWLMGANALGGIGVFGYLARMRGAGIREGREKAKVATEEVEREARKADEAEIAARAAAGGAVRRRKAKAG